MPVRRRAFVKGRPACRTVVLPHMRQRLAVVQPGRAFAADGGVGGVLRAVHHRAGHVADHRRDQFGEGRAQQQDKLAAARLARQRDEIVRRPDVFADPVQASLEVFQRRIGDVVR